ARGLRVFEISAATREGLRELTDALAELVDEHRGTAPPERTRIVIRPTAVDDAGFRVYREVSREASREGDVYVVTGRPERWVRQTNFDNDEAIGYLADRLARLGVEEGLAKAGAEPGATVRIGAHEFDWHPTLYASEDFVPGTRGIDYRIQ